MNQDAQLALILRPGMVFRQRTTVTDEPVSDDRQAFLCVANLEWAVLAWPLVAMANGHLNPNCQGQLEWHFVFKLEQYEAGVAEPVLDCDQIVLKECCWQPAAECCLGAFSADLVFRQLVLLAEIGFEISKPRSMARPDLLRELCTRASGGDTRFAEAVVSKEASSKRKKDQIDQEDAVQDQFAELLLDHMDKDDAVEFQRDFGIGVKENIAKKKKWQKLRQNAADVPWCITNLNIRFHCVENLTRFILCQRSM